jgi:hypothetical protein
MSGLLGALGGLGQGMSQVGAQWADDLKRKRIEELRHTRELEKELRGEKRALSAEERSAKRELEKEGRHRKYTAEDRDADHGNRMALERFRASLRASETAGGDGAKPLTEADKRATYDRLVKAAQDKVIPPVQELLQMGVIQERGGYAQFIKDFESFSDSVPDYLEWKELIYGEANPARERGLDSLGRPASSAPRGDTPAGPPPEGAIGRKSDGQLYIVENGEARLLTAEEKRERGIR